MSGDFERLRARHPVPWTYGRGEQNYRDIDVATLVIRDAAGAEIIVCIADCTAEYPDEPEYSPRVEAVVAALVAMVNDAAAGDR
jgi:hypothetical protein